MVAGAGADARVGSMAACRVLAAPGESVDSAIYLSGQRAGPKKSNHPLEQEHPVEGTAMLGVANDLLLIMDYPSPQRLDQSLSVLSG